MLSLYVGVDLASVNWERIGKVIYSDWVEVVVPRLVRRRFALRDVRLAGKRRDMPGHPLEPLLDAAESSGVISFEEADDFLSLDFVVAGQTPLGNEIYVLVEASDLVRPRDVKFVMRMAGLFRKLVESRVEAAVLGEGISDGAAEGACWGNVRFIKWERSQ